MRLLARTSTAASSTGRSDAQRVALALVVAAWACRLATVAVPGLDGSGRIAAEALYLAELAAQHDAAVFTPSPGVEAIATQVHRRTARLLIWIGLGTGLCLFAALVPQARRAATVAAGLIFLLGWIRLDAYAHVGLLKGLDLKLRLVQDDPLRLAQFALVDAVLPLVVVGAVAATLAGALRRVT